MKYYTESELENLLEQSVALLNRPFADSSWAYIRGRYYAHRCEGYCRGRLNHVVPNSIAWASEGIRKCTDWMNAS